jgi:ribonuclease HI
MSRDLFLYTCVELISDVLSKKAFFRYKWIPRENNGVCDALAKQATTSQSFKVSIIDP